MITIICLVGVVITWPILIPINVTGGAKQHELDLLTFGNIKAAEKKRYYAHAILAWIFFSMHIIPSSHYCLLTQTGFVIFIITRETIYFINLRQAYLLAPFNASRISARTVLFTDIPAEYLKSDNLKLLFGNTFRRFWRATDTTDLENDVKERDCIAMKLEGAEIKLSKNANNRRIKWEKKRQNVTGDEEAALASKWLDKKDRPTHTLGKIPLFGKKVDTIEWSRSELRKLIPKIQDTQLRHEKEEATILPAVFVEFSTQHAAQVAYRRMSPSKSPFMNPSAISITPAEVIWENLNLSRKQRRNRKIAAVVFVMLMIIFWSLPVSVVGAISNIDYLIEKLPWLAFIKDMPPKVVGVVTGLLPSVSLAVLIMLVPIVLRYISKLSGEVTLPAAELKTQSWHMAFQVIQVFLITTFSSGAAATVSQLIKHPEKATTLLAENLPKASNFYISYFIVQGLGMSLCSDVSKDVPAMLIGH